MSTPLEDFFAQFANLGFEYRESTTAHKNFERLQQVSHWGEDSEESREALYHFNNALTRQFNVTVGTATNLPSWQSLCKLIDIMPPPATLQECRRRMQDSHVNIVDLLESARTGSPVRKFRTVEELSAYTISTGRIFPKGSAYAGGLLRALLREIFKYGKREKGDTREQKGGTRGQNADTREQNADASKQNGGAKKRRSRRRRARRRAAAAQTSAS